jgi:hypothetical protein
MMSEEEYVKKVDLFGPFCPVCGSSLVSGGFVEVSGVEAYQRVDCVTCGANWIDTYRLSRFNWLTYSKLVVQLKVGEKLYVTAVANQEAKYGKTTTLHLSIEGCPDSDQLYAEDQFGFRYQRVLPDIEPGVAVFQKI